MPVIKNTDAAAHKCPFNAFNPCLGQECMAWAESGRPYEYTTTNDLVDTPDGQRPIVEAPQMPDGEGWEKDGMETQVGYHQSAKLGLPKARSQQWVRKVAMVQGRCGRVADGGYW